MTGTNAGGSADSGETPADTPESDEKTAAEDAASEDKPEADQPSDADVDDSSDEPVAAPAAEQTEGETDPAEASEDEAQVLQETEADSGEIELESNSVNEVVPAETVKVSLFQPAVGEDGKVTYEELKDATATVTYMENTVDDDGTVNKEAEKILFKVTPAVGKVVDDVKFAVAENAEGLAQPAAPKPVEGKVAPNTQYAVTTKVADLIKNNQVVGIYITTSEVEYTVNFATGTNGSGAKAYLKKTDGSEYDFGSEKKSATVKFSERDSLTFAVTGLGDTVEGTKVTAAKGAGKAATLSGSPGTQGTAPSETKYLAYTLKLSEVEGLSSTADDTVTVTLDKVGKATVTLSEANLKKENVTIGNVTGVDKYSTYKELKAGSYVAGDKIVFTATPAPDYKLLPFTAYWTTDVAADTKNNLDVTPEPEGDKTYYVIDLTGIEENANLHVELGSELNEEKDTVKTISFAGDEHVKVIASTEGDYNQKDLVGKSINFKPTSTTAPKYEFKVQADEGYTVTEIKAAFTKTYKDDTADETIVIGTDGKKIADENDLYPFNGEKVMTALFSGEDVNEDKSNKAWTTKKVEITITTKVETSVLDAEVRFVSKGVYGDTAKGAYKVVPKTEDGKVEKKAGTTDAYTVKAGTQYLEFTVEGAETDPDITVQGKSGVAEKTEGSTYRIPAVSLGDENVVVVTRKAKAVKVNYNDKESLNVTVKDVEADCSAKTEKADKPANGYNQQNKYSVNADADIQISVSLLEGKKAQITGVTYQVGDASLQDADEGAEKGTYIIKSVKASEDITVYVNKNTDKREVLTGAEYTLDKEGVYLIKNYLGKITAQVYSGEEPLALFSASVKHGAVNAATIAVIGGENGDMAEIVVDDREYNEVLTVTLTTLEDRTPITFRIKTDTPIASVDYDNIKDGKVELPVDTKVTTGVSMTGSAPLSNLAWAIVGEKDTDISKADWDNKVIEPTWDPENGMLTIRALPSDKTGAGQTKPVRIVFYDTKNNNKIVKDSDIFVTVTQATVLDKAPKVEISENGASARELRVNITSPEGVREDLAVGSLWYKVEVTKPSASDLANVDADIKTAIDDAKEWLDAHKYYSKKEIDDKGFVNLPVIADSIKDGKVEIAGKAVSGFGVKVTLVQAIEEVYGAEELSDNNTVQGGSASKTGATRDPYYENTQTGKLKLKNGTTTINTGDTRWIPVAEPQFDQNADYTDVRVEFVDVKTGKPKDAPGMEKDYDAANNKVVVRFDGAWGYYSDNIDDEDYKDLGVKITAVTKKTGYGVAGTVKLNVVNGIEYINAEAQPFVLKTSGKPASFKVSVELNGTTENKKYAPKKKTVTYEIVSPDTGLDGNTEADLENKAAAKAAAEITLANGKTVDGVSVKNGTVTVAKEYKLSENEKDNKFKVLVKAADYDGNTVVGLTDPIEITVAGRTLGNLVIMQPGKGNDWSRATIAAKADNGQISVTKNVTCEGNCESDCEYRAVVLKDGVGTDEDYYNLDNTDLIVDPDELTFTPAKGGVSVDEEGYIHVTKLGKATITAVEKINKSNKKILKNVTLAQKETKMGLQLVQMKDSALSREVETFYGNAPKNDISFSGNNITYFGLNVVEDGDQGKVIDLSDVKLSFKKNVKNVTPKENKTGYQYVIVTTGDPGTITFQSKKQGNKEFTLKNNTFAQKKAPKVALSNKGTKIMADSGVQSASYTVTAKGDSFEGKYVMLSVDGTKKNPENIYNAFTPRINKNPESYIDRVLPIGDGDAFELKINPGKTTGSYNLNVAVGTLENGEFHQEYADAKLAVKVVKNNINLKVTNKYTLDPEVASKTAIKYNEKDGSAWFVNTPDADGNYALNAIVDHKENDFNHYFEAKVAEGIDVTKGDKAIIGTIGLKDGLPKGEVDALVTNPKSEDLTGFIRVQNAGKQVDVKITIVFKSYAKSLKAVATPVLAGSDAILDIKLYNGKEYVAVKNYTVENGDGFVRAGFVNGPADEKGEVLYGDIRLKGDGAVGDGKKTIKLTVTPKNSTSYEESKPEKPDVAVPIDVKVTVAKSNLRNKVVFAKGANTWVASNSDFVGVKDEEGFPASGAWVKDIPYSFKNRLSIKDGTIISVAGDEKAPYVSFTSDNYNVNSETQDLTVKIDKEKLEASVDGKKLKWGGKVTVTATFSYKGTGDDKEYDPKLESDKAKITITLPKTKPNGTIAPADFQNAQKEIQDMVETMSAYYAKLTADRKDYDYTEYNKDILNKVRSRILEVAGGATVGVTTDYEAVNKGKKPEGQASAYSVDVKDKTGTSIYSNVFKANFELTVDEVWQNIYKLYYPDWSPAKSDAQVKDIFSLDETTSTGDYAEMIRNMLEIKGQITNNIAVDVEAVDKGVQAPTTKEDGHYNAKLFLTDKSVAPGEYGARQHELERPLEYKINAIETTEAVKDRLETELAKTTLIQEVVNEAWASVAEPGDNLTKPEVQKAFEEEVQENIKKKAETLLEADTSETTANKSLTVKGFKVVANVPAFSVTVDETAGQLTAIVYTLVLTDSTAGAENSEIEVNVNETGKTITLEKFQSLTALKEAAQKNITTIAGAAAPEEVKTAVKAKIEGLSTNPGFDMTGVTVKVVDGSLTAPAGDVNGLVSVTVAFTKTDAPETQISNIVILAAGDDFVIEGEDKLTPEQLAAAKDIERVKSAITSTLSAAELKDMIEGMQTNAETIDLAGVQSKIAGIVEKLLDDMGGSYVLVDTATKKNNIVFADADQSKVKAPENSGDDYIIPAFTVQFKAEDTTAELKVAISEKNLGKMATFQNFAEASKALEGWAGKTLELNHIPGLTAADTGIANGFKDVTGLKAAVEAAVDAEGIITNKNFKVSSEAETTDVAHKTTYADGEDNYQFVVTSWKVTLTNTTTGSSDTAKVYVDINIKTEAATPAVTGITFKAVDEKPITYKADGSGIDGDGSADNDTVDINVKGDKTTVEVTLKEVAVTNAATDPKYQAVEWTVTDKDGAPLDEDSITINKETGVITIPLSEAGDTNRTQIIKVVAKSKEKGLNGQPVESAPLFIKLIFEPKVVGLTIKEGSDFIELDENNANAGVEYKAELKGNHLLDADKIAYTWKLTDSKDAAISGQSIAKVEKAPATGAATVTVANGATLLEGKKIKLGLSLDGTYAGWTAEDKANTNFKLTKEIELRKFTDKNTPTITLGPAPEGVELGTLASNQDVQKITVTGGTVNIPLTISGDPKTDREWEYVVKDDKGNAIPKITITQASEDSPATLDIDKDVPEMADEVMSEDGKTVRTPAQKIKLTATSTGSGATTDVETELTVALVIKKDVKGVKLLKSDNAGAVQNNDKGTGNLDYELTAGSPTMVYLKTDFDGTHIDRDKELKKVTYKITQQTRNMGATCTDTNGLVTITVPKDKAGFVELTATYTEGEGDTAKVLPTKRVIKITDPSLKREIKLNQASTAAGLDAGTIEIDEEYAADFTQTYEVSNAKGAVTWTLDAKEELKKYVSIPDGTLTIDTDPEKEGSLPAGTYSITVWASWEEEGVEYQKSQPVEITVKKVVTGIEVCGADNKALAKDGGGNYTLNIPTNLSDSITLTAKAIGERFTGTETVAVNVEKDSTSSVALDVTGNEDGTVTISKTGSSALTAGDTLDITFSIDAAPTGKTIVVPAGGIEQTLKITIITPSV